MTLKLLGNIFSTLVRLRAFLGLFAAFCLSGCITAANPILGDAKALLGERIEVHVFSAARDGTREHSIGVFEWSGSRYVPRSGDFTEFTIHPFEGRDSIIQGQAGRNSRNIEFALARRIAEGVYLIIPIQHEDADEPTRQRFCTKTQIASCLITTPEQLFVFAHATAARDDDSSAVAVVTAAPKK
jgi:hypothetical protein